MLIIAGFPENARFSLIFFFQERYRLSGLAGEDSGPVAGVIGYEGMEALVDLCESGFNLYRMGRLCAWTCLIGAILGAALMIGPCWLAKWEAVSAAKVLLYMVLWLIPGAAAAMMLRK